MSFGSTATSRAVFDAAPVGICVLCGSDVVYANPAFLTLMQVEAVTALPKTVVERILTFAPSKDRSGFEIEHALPGKPSVWANVSITDAVFENKPAAIVWAADITAVKSVAVEAARMMEMKSSFLASMSHEIRTPMQSVYGLLELIAEEKISDDVRDMVGTARKSASGLLEILDDILDVAKVDAGKMELDQFEVPVRTLAYGVLECMEVKLSKNVKLVADVAQDVPFVVTGDPTRLRQILLNLIGNAMKFTEEGSVTLGISLATRHLPPQDEGSFGLRFEIRDTGIGMADEVAGKLFQAFTQADSSTTRKYGGTGLGLSICQKLITLMGGKIGITSVLGKGSTVWFEIPTKQAADSSTVELPKLDGLVVLSVEDHPKGAKEIFSSLKSMGAEVISVGTFAEGLDLIKKRPFDVAVIDQGLPDGLGIDLMKEAAKLRPYMGMILYTVRDDIGLQYSTRVLGAKYLSKPASRAGLGEAVKGAARKTKTRVLEGSRKLLIAEDTKTVQDVLKRQLDKLGVTATFVETGVEALRALDTKEYGILFTDLHMPDMDGYQVVASIRAREEAENVDSLKRFPVIVLTADVQMGQRQAYLSYGFDECLLKPVSLGQFRQLLVRWGLLDAQESGDDSAPAPIVQDAKETAVTDAAPPAVDRAAMVQQMGGFDASTIEMLGVFITMTEPYIAKIEKAFRDENRLQLKELAHSLKGAARSACCMQLGNFAADIQDRAERGVPVDAGLIKNLKDAFEHARAEIGSMKI